MGHLRRVAMLLLAMGALLTTLSAPVHGASIRDAAKTPVQSPTPVYVVPTPPPHLSGGGPKISSFAAVYVGQNGRWVKTDHIRLGDRVRLYLRFRRIGNGGAQWQHVSAILRIYRHGIAPSSGQGPGALYSVAAKRTAGRNGYSVFTVIHRFVAPKFRGRLVAIFYVSNGVATEALPLNFRAM